MYCCHIYKIVVLILLLSLSGCSWLGKNSACETIFDQVISIPKELILDVPYLPPLCDEITGLKKEFVDVEQGKLYCEQEGQGTPLLLINGGPGETHNAFHPYFSQAKDFARLIYYDQRGTGQSSIDETGATYTLKQAVQDIENLRKALKIDRWAVLGWSYGGFLAQCYALTYPERVMSLILVAASDEGLKKVTLKAGRGKMFLSKTELDAIAAIYAAMNKGKLTLLQTMYNKELAGDWKRQGYYKPTPDEIIRSSRYEWSPAPGFCDILYHDTSQISLDGKFDDFEIPTLLVESKWDLTWDTDKAEFMRKNHPHAQFEYFEKSGHCIFGDEPEKFFSMLKSFLETASKQQIMYKPGNRLTWPKPMSPLARSIQMASSLPDNEKKEKRMLDYYQQAVKEKSAESTVWEKLFGAFYSLKKHPEICLDALQRFEKFAQPHELQEAGHCIHIWKGQLLDVLGKRTEAIKYYQQVLDNYKGTCNECYNIDRTWLEDHIKTPFTW